MEKYPIIASYEHKRHQRPENKQQHGTGNDGNPHHSGPRRKIDKRVRRKMRRIGRIMRILNVLFENDDRYMRISLTSTIGPMVINASWETRGKKTNEFATKESASEQTLKTTASPIIAIIDIRMFLLKNRRALWGKKVFAAAAINAPSRKKLPISKNSSAVWVRVLESLVP